MAITRLGVGGPSKNYTRPIGAAVAAPHPFSDGTRLGQMAIGVRPYAGFIAKTLAVVAGPHPFSDGTRLGQMAIGVRPYAGFVAKGAAAVVSAQRIRGFTRNVGRLMNP